MYKEKALELLDKRKLGKLSNKGQAVSGAGVRADAGCHRDGGEEGAGQRR